MNLIWSHQLIESFLFRFYDRNNYHRNNHRNSRFIRFCYAILRLPGFQRAVDKVLYYEIDSSHITYRSSMGRVAFFSPSLKNKRSFMQAIVDRRRYRIIAYVHAYTYFERTKAIGRKAQLAILLLIALSLVNDSKSEC